jgi:hypothetical protein
VRSHLYVSRLTFSYDSDDDDKHIYVVGYIIPSKCKLTQIEKNDGMAERKNE